MAELYRITFQRKRIVTSYLNGAPLGTETLLIEETMGGLPARTVQSYRQMLGANFLGFEPEPQDVQRGKPSARVAHRLSSKPVLTALAKGPKKAPKRPAEEPIVSNADYGTLVNKMAGAA